MTAADYVIIRQRLDHPQVVVWDPCAVTLAEDDPERPAPDFPGIYAWLGVVRARTGARIIGDAVARRLAAFEAWTSNQTPRRVLELLVRVLSGDEFGAVVPDEAPRLSPSGGSLFRVERAAVMLARVIEELVQNPSANISLVLGECLNQVSLSFRTWSSGWASTRPEPDPSAKRFLAATRARCRALLPIADVTTAEIEWGEIELPPRPVDGDLTPGDGG